MAGSLNKVLLIGRLGADPEIKQMKKEIDSGQLIDPMAMQQLELAQMEMSLQPPEPDPAEQGIDPADYEQGNI